jgi:hypothetical protein
MVIPAGIPTTASRQTEIALVEGAGFAVRDVSATRLQGK